MLLWIAMHPSEDLIASFWRSNWNQLSFQILIHGEELIHNILHTKFIALNSLMNSWHEFIYDFIALKSRAWFHFSMNSFALTLTHDFTYVCVFVCAGQEGLEASSNLFMGLTGSLSKNISWWGWFSFACRQVQPVQEIVDSCLFEPTLSTSLHPVQSGKEVQHGLEDFCTAFI